MCVALTNDPIVGVVNVLLTNVWVPLRVTTVESISNVNVPEPDPLSTYVASIPVPPITVLLISS